MHHGEAFILGFLVCACIGGLWVIGTGLMNAAQMKRRKPALSVVHDEQHGD